MRRNPKILLLILTTLILITISIIVPLSFKGPILTADQVRQQIDSEIPIGSGVPQVISFLDSRQISHSGYVEGKKYDLDKGDYVKMRLVQARVENAERRFLTTYTIYMRFSFDENAKLKEYDVVRREDK